VLGLAWLWVLCGVYDGCMRYPDGGGLSAEGRARREKVRRQAAQLFAQGVEVPQIAGLLRVSTKSVYAWRRAWRSGGEEALASKGPGGYACRLDDGQLAELAAALEAGPAACGRDRDQRWTLERVRALAGRLFGVRYTLRGTSYLLHRLGFSPQVPAHRAAQRDEAAVAAWRAATWVRVRELAAATGAWICFEDEAGQALRPRKARTWARRGHTPVLAVSGDNGRLSVAGLACLKAGAPGRFFYRVHVHRRRKGRRPSLSEDDYATLLSAAHRALQAPLIVVWDNLNTHRSTAMRARVHGRRRWLTVIALPAYAPELNAVEGAWANMKNGLGNLADCTLDQLEATVRSRLRRIQRQPALINAFLGQTGLTLESEPP
jgi:transposase